MSVLYIRDERGNFVPIPTIAGHTPVKGKDYWTAEDIQGLIAEIKAALNTETWTFTLGDGTTVTKEVYVE